MMPDYYLVVRATNSSTAPVVLLDPIYDNQNNTSGGISFPDIYPGVVTQHLGGTDSNISISYTNNPDGSLASAQVTNRDAAGTVPLYDGSQGYAYRSYEITQGNYAGDYVFIERPSQNDSDSQTYDKVLPPEASLRCFNPQQNGYISTTFSVANNNVPGIYNATTGTYVNPNVDPIANPELGAIECSANENASFAIYWNDMGGGLVQNNTAGNDNMIYWNAATVFTCPTPSTTAGPVAPATLSG